MLPLSTIVSFPSKGIWANEAVTNTLVIEGDILAKGDYFALPEANGQIISEDRLQLNFTSPVSLRWIKLSMSSRAARTPVLMGILRADEFNLGEVTVLPGNNWTLPDFDDVISLLFRHPFRIDQTSTTPIFKEDLIRIEIGYSGKGKAVLSISS